jgi:ribosome-associated protein
MRTSPGATPRSRPEAKSAKQLDGSNGLLATVLASLSDAKAEDVISIDLKGKTSIGDYMVIATGRSQRHVGAIAEQLLETLKEKGHKGVRVEGVPQCDWVLVDSGDVIVHLFRPEVRQFYNLEKMWTADRPADVPAN